MTDAWLDELVAPLSFEAKRIVFPVSRLVVDPERFPNDDEEPMAMRGMGATYTQLSSGEPLRRLSVVDRSKLMENYYYPHHRKLTAAVESCFNAFGHCLIIDVHSFSSAPLPHEEDQSTGRPEICIGFDAFHSPFPDEVDIIAICNQFGFSGSANRPFGGSIVPSKFLNTDDRVRSFMIEVRRDVYMSELTGQRRSNFAETAEQISAVIKALVEVADLPGATV